MATRKWRGLDDDGLERLLVQRWLYRGAVLAAVFFAAVVLTGLGLHGISGSVDRLTVGFLLALGLGAGAVAFVMRMEDREIHAELRRRRTSRPSPPRSS